MFQYKDILSHNLFVKDTRAVKNAFIWIVLVMKTHLSLPTIVYAFGQQASHANLHQPFLIPFFNIHHGVT